MARADRERRPAAGWDPLPVPPTISSDSMTLAASRWKRGSVLAISTLDLAELPGGGGEAGPTWHLSVSRAGKRPRPRDVDKALRDFDMREAEEDNHHPGVARHFFLPVDPAFRGVCECKTTEDVIVEPDGYTWTNPKPNDFKEGCRGCDFERLRGKPCPLHRRQERAP